MPEVISDGLSWFFAWLFAIASLHKLANQAYYRDLLAEWLPNIPNFFFITYMMALVEIIIVLMLLVPAGYFFAEGDIGLMSAAVLLVIYALFMNAQLAQGRRNIQCGCAGPATGVLISPALIARNLVCSALALVALIPTTSAIENIATVGSAVNLIELASRSLSLAIAVFLIAVYLVSEQMIVNMQRLAGEQSR